jgi:hypothetical protein
VFWIVIIGSVLVLLSLFVVNKVIQAESKGAPPPEPHASSIRQTDDVAFIARAGSQAAILPFRRITYTLTTDARPGMMITGRIGKQPARFCVLTQDLAIDLVGLVRIAPFAFNELAALAGPEDSALLRDAPIEAVTDLKAYLLAHHIETRDLHTPALWLANPGPVMAVQSIPSQGVVRWTLKFERVSIDLYGSVAAYVDRLRHAQGLEGPVSVLARKLGDEPLLAEAQPACFMAHVTSDAVDEMFPGDLTAAELATLGDRARGLAKQVRAEHRA